MNKVQYYKLSNSMDPEIIGDINSKNYNKQIESFIDPENTTKERLDLYRDFNIIFESKELDLNKFKAHSKTIMTDLMSSSFFPVSGHFISNSVKPILNNHIVKEFEIKPCTVFKNKKEFEYNILALKNTTDCIDFEKSKFGVIDDTKLTPELKKEIEVNSVKDFKDQNRKLYFETNGELKVTPLKIVLSSKLDLFRFDLDKTSYVSERLKNKIESEGLTGFDFEKFAVKTEFYEDF